MNDYIVIVATNVKDKDGNIKRTYSTVENNLMNRILYNYVYVGSKDSCKQEENNLNNQKIEKQ